MNKKSYTKRALTLSLVLLLIWGVMGASTTVAWFTDTTPEQKNSFFVGDLDLVVSLRDEFGNYKELDTTTSVFDEYALYEPGYVQVVYFKIENLGDIAFDYTSAVTVNDYTTVTNVYGQTFNLVPYLTYGVVFADSDAELMELVNSRSKALAIARAPLNNYVSDVDTLEVNEERYMALIVTMPTWVDNNANHNGVAPLVELGISVKASQSGTMK